MGKHKSNIIKGESKHHGSTGNYYSYGNKANYDMVELSSVAQYKQKKCIKMARYKGSCIEELSQMEMQCGIKQLSQHIPILPTLISPIISTAYFMQKSIGNININGTNDSDDGIWQTSMRVNCETQKFYTELDCTYTLLHVPHQKRLKGSSKYHFLFKFSDDMNISFHLKAGISIIFSGQYITHRQSCDTIN